MDDGISGDAAAGVAAGPMWIGDLIGSVAKIRLVMGLTAEQLDRSAGSDESGNDGFVQAWLDALARFVEAGGRTLSAVVEFSGLLAIEPIRSPKAAPIETQPTVEPGTRLVAATTLGRSGSRFARFSGAK